MSVSVCRCCCFFKRKRKKNTPRHKWSSSTGLKRSKCPAQLIDLRNQKGPIQSKRGRQLKDLDRIVLWSDQIKTVCWDVQDACVFWWESFFIFLFFSLFFPPPRCVGMFCRPVVQTGNLFVGILQRIILCCFFSSPRHPAVVFFSPRFCHIFLLPLLFCGIAKEETDLPVKSCNLQPVAYYDFFVWLTKSYFHFPSVKSQFRVVCPSLVCSLILTQSPFGLSWRGTECKPEHTRNQECNCLHVQAQRASVCHLAPALFSSKEVNPGTGTRAWENRRPETPPALCSLRMISAHAAWLKHSP